ncbi:TVP38/TMEM64 family protein [Lysinibacillus sp. KU-BSD001]|uniref:TVP38/TMEM64 family protein n=1 Tax=Lysinibacillus sp. KU-BSD001 TaxID=3141328 RepID=UPI0036E883FA
MFDWLTIENIEEVEKYYRTLGPLVGVLLPFIESFLPFLPLVVIVVANANAFGLFFGFILSWLGTVLGSYVVFLIVRKFGRHPKLHFFTQSKRVQKLITWVDMNGLSPLFVLLCFPFTPSVLVNIVAGLSNIRKHFYLVAVILGKMVMIFVMSFVGHDLTALIRSPIKLVLAVVVIFLLWLFGKAVEVRLNKRVERDLRNAERKEHGGEV